MMLQIYKIAFPDIDFLSFFALILLFGAAHKTLQVGESPPPVPDGDKQNRMLPPPCSILGITFVCWCAVLVLCQITFGNYGLKIQPWFANVAKVHIKSPKCLWEKCVGYKKDGMRYGNTITLKPNANVYHTCSVRLSINDVSIALAAHTVNPWNGTGTLTKQCLKIGPYNKIKFLESSRTEYLNTKIFTQTI